MRSASEEQGDMQEWCAFVNIKDIAERIRTQDNRMTHNPIFIVQRKREVVGYENASIYKWYDCDWREITDPDEITRLDEAQDNDDEAIADCRKLGVFEYWEFVTACFTEEGCKEYLRCNGHNHGETRIYVASGYRNDEWEAVREHLKGIGE